MRTCRLVTLCAMACLAVAGCPDRKNSSGPAASKPARAGEAAPAKSAPTAAAIQKAFAAGDVEAAAGMMDPRRQGQYRRNFQANQAAMARVGKLLATRKLRTERGRIAEYEVSEDGKTYTLMFELVDGQWRLMGL